MISEVRLDSARPGTQNEVFHGKGVRKTEEEEGVAGKKGIR